MATLTAADATTLERCMAVEGVAVFPADTVYGLACEPESKEGVRRLHALKRRRGARPAALLFFQPALALAALPELGPRTRDALLALNGSYVFFRELPALRADEGPLGALGAPLTPGRSIAVDRRYIPLGLPVWVDTTDPLDGSPLQRLMLAQDAGGAINGPVRGDVFFGWGAGADAAPKLTVACEPSSSGEADGSGGAGFQSGSSGDGDPPPPK